MSDDDSPAVDGDLLDAIHDLFIGRIGPENAITSAEISRRLDIDDGAAQPKTRDAVKTLIDERDVPIIASSNGYYVPADDSQVNDYVARTTSRAQETLNRATLVQDAWEEFKERQRERRSNRGEAHAD